MPPSHLCLIECSYCLMMKKKLIFYRKYLCMPFMKLSKTAKKKYAVCMLLRNEKKCNFIIKNIFF